MVPDSALVAGVNGKESSMNYPTLYRTLQVDGLSIFYREAGPEECASASPAARTSFIVADV